MSDQRPTPQGNVYSTPEGGPLTPPTMREHFAEPIPGYQPATSATTGTPEAEVIGSSASPEASPGSQQVPIRINVGGSDSSSQSGSAKSGQPEIDPEEIARDVVERLKPVLDAAEDVATKALDLSARGWPWLVEPPDERRRQRESADSSGTSESS